jgi:putative sporulation protein YtaF
MGLHILPIFLLAVSSNLDNVGVGTSYGIRRVNIPFSSNLLIAFVTSAGTYLSMALGKEMTNYLNPNIANALGALMIGCTGLWIFIRGGPPHNEGKNDEAQQPQTNFSDQSLPVKILMILDHPFLADADFSGHISMNEGFVLALALTLNNLSNGIGAGLLSFNAALTTSFVLILSIFTIWFGIQFGQYSGTHWFGKHSSRISGLILISLGIYELLFNSI